MNEALPNLAADPLPEIEMLMIFAGPPGAGKTTLAEDLIAGKRPDGLDGPLPEPVTRTEIRSMRQKDYRGGTLIVEFSTVGINVSATITEIERLVDAALRCIVVTYQIDRASLIRQYAQRLRHERLRRTPEWMRYLRFGKLKQLAVYFASRQIEEGYSTWDEVLGVLRRREDIRFLRVTSPYGERGRYWIGDDSA